MKREELLLKSISQKLTLEQERELYTWIHESEENLNEYLRIQKLYYLLQLEYDTTKNEKEIFKKLKNSIHSKKRLSMKRRMIVSSSVAAAILFLSFLIYNRVPNQADIQEINNNEFKLVSYDTSPICDTIVELGTPKAYLKTTSGIIAINDNNEVPTEPAVTQQQITYNTITVPAKGTFSITLEDSTKVLLNGGSSLTYPVHFAKEERSILLSGEAYFEVTSNPQRPFTVMAKGTKSVVYGTKINVCAYPQSKYVSTTLFSGKVRVNDVELKPGEQAIKNDLSDNVEVNTIDLAMIEAWTKGIFYFDNSSLDTIMEQLSQWYGITVDFETPNLKKEKFTIVFKRSEELTYALKLISNTKKVKLKLMGNELYVEKGY